MLLLLAVIVLAPLLYLPGALVLTALSGAAQPRDLLERTYLRVVAGTLLNGWLAFTLAELGIFATWLHLILIIVICLVARWRAWRLGALHEPQVPLGLAALNRPSSVVGRRSSVVGRPSSVVGRRSSIIQLLAFAALGLICLLLVGRPFEVVLGVRDGGVYANTGFAIARTGSIVQHDALVEQIGSDKRASDPGLRAAAAQAETNFLGIQNAERFLAPRLRAAGFMINEGDLEAGRVVPQFFHLFPAWIGLLAALLGLQGGLLATGLFGFLGVWSVAMLGRRLAGPWVGLLAGLLLALNGVQVWFSRYSTSEAAAQFLTFAGLYCFATWQSSVASRQSPVGDPTTLPSTVHRPPSTVHRPSSISPALLAGLAVGQLVMVRIDALFLVLPLLLGYLLYCWLTRRWQTGHTALAAGLGAMLLHAALHIIFISRGYFFDTGFARLQDQSAIIASLTLPFLTDTLRDVYFSTSRSILKNPWRLWVELAALLVMLGALLWLRRDGRLLAWFERFVVRWRGWLLGLSALAIMVAAGYAYLVRPQVLDLATLAALPGCLAPEQLRAPAGACLRLQGYIGAPLPLPEGLRAVYAIPLANMVRVGWYLSPLGVLLGVVGFALWWRNGFTRAAWPFLLIGLLAAVYWIRQSYGTSDQTYIYILRRYVPAVYPTFCLGIAYALVALANQRPTTNDQRRTQPSSLIYRPSSIVVRRSLATLLALTLLAFALVTNRTIYRHTEYGGALDQLASIAARFGPRDIVLLRGGAPAWGGFRDMPDLVATPLIYAYGVNAFTIKSKEPGNYAEPLARYIRHWQDEGRNVYLLLGASGGLSFPGQQATRVDQLALNLREFEALNQQKPANIQEFSLDYTLYQLTPGAVGAPATAPLQPTDYLAQIRGFYRPELVGDTQLAWTDGDGQVRLPWPQTGQPLTIQLTLAAGKRPAALGPARTCLSYRPEPSLWAENPQYEALFTELTCVTPGEAPATYTITIDPRGIAAPPTGTLLLRIASPTWVPATATLDPPSNDQRSLGVQFGGLTVAPAPP